MEELDDRAAVAFTAGDEGHFSAPAASLRRQGKQEKRRPAATVVSDKFLVVVLLLLMLLGTLNFLSFKIMFTAYGDKYSYFVSQAVNLLYLVFGGAVLYPRMAFTNLVTPEMRRYPARKFLFLGLLDSLGTFLAAMGSATPGRFQPLLNQTLIPLTMLVTALVLRARYAGLQILGAVLIVGGAVVAVMPPFLSGDGGAMPQWYVVFLFFLSNVPMACSATYKERAFRGTDLDVWYLTQWVSFWQFALGFLFMPLLWLPGFGASTPESSLTALWDGVRCTFGVQPECAANHCGVLLVSYVAINVAFNTLGLYLTKRGGAVLNYVSYALLLPVSMLSFNLPFLGKYKEPFSYWTTVGLVVILTGFVLYRRFQRAPEEDQRRSSAGADGEPPTAATALLSATAGGGVANSSKVPASFQERIVGMNMAHRVENSYDRSRAWSFSPEPSPLPHVVNGNNFSKSWGA